MGTIRSNTSGLIVRNERIILITDFHQKPDCIPFIQFEEESNPDKK